MSSEPSTATPRRAFPLWVPVASISAGVTLAVARYVFLPLAMGSLPQSLFVGTCCAFVIAGWQGWRALRGSGSKVSVPAIALGALVPAAAILGAFALATRAESVESMAFRPVDLPGLRASLPEWKVRETSDNPAFGAHVVNEPDAAGLIELRWNYSTPMTPDEMFAQLEALLPNKLQIETREAATVGGHRAATAYGTIGKLRMAYTAWSCPEDNRMMTALTLLERTPSDVRAIHERILTGIACHTGTAKKPSAGVRFEPGPELTRVDHAVNLVYAGSGGELVDFTPGIPGKKLVAEVTQDGNLRHQMVATELELTGVALHEVGAQGSDSRRLWTGEGRDEEGETKRVTLLALYCPASDQSVVGFHLISSSAPEGRGAEVLSRAACP